ncbi:hypothetical protein F511_30114 [Dorcoceras hygrometricum]|uniref:Uncharacterized protein n=1 Tax=Dorcoceras hygrometricum TaxID=472368 RepID=A0A2Z7AV62_9LAMI|nr:hypothetical protein F511_30114 [Dorcoceras hygrometricum]
MPEFEELPIDEEHQEMSVQNMVDRIEGQSHGPATAKQTVKPRGKVPEKNAVDMEEASKMMAEGILAYVKAMAWKKGTHPLVGEMKLFQKIPVMARGNGSGNLRPQLQQPYGMTNPMNQPAFLREFLNEKRAMNKKRVKAYWIPKGQMFEAHRNYGESTTKHVSRGSPGNIGGSTASWPRNQYLPKKMRETHHSNDMNRRMQREIQKEENYRPRLLPTNTHKEHNYIKKHKYREIPQGAKVAEHHRQPRFFLLSSNEVDDMWKLARHKTFPKSLTRTQKIRMLREIAAAKRELTGAVVSKFKFCRKLLRTRAVMI